MEIKLGQEVQDRVTGYKGIAIARSHYLQGCDRILVQPKMAKDGTIPEATGFDEPDLNVISDGVFPIPEPKPKKNGGPRPFASRRPDITR